MDILRVVVRVLEAINEGIGRAVAWLALGCVLFCFTVVVMRYGFSTSIIWMQEAYVWMHAAVFMVGAGYTYLHGGHVRVDIFYSNMSARRRAYVDIFGTLVFLFPWLIVLASYGAKFILDSWAVREPSPQPGGIEYLYLLKTMIWVFCGVLALQGLAVIGRCLLYLGGDERYAPASGGE